MKTARLPVEWWVLKLEVGPRGPSWNWWDRYDSAREAHSEFRRRYANGEPGTFWLVKVTCEEFERSTGGGK